MAQSLAFIHTSHVLIPVFAGLAKELLPGIDVFHMLDESLIRNTIKTGHITRTTVRRVVTMIESAHEGGAEAVMVTCSSIGAAVPVARELLDFPILRVDEPMAEAAVQAGSKIGVAATIQTTLEPTVALLKQTAAQMNRTVDVVPRLCEGAFAAVLAGDTDRHDRMVLEALENLRSQVDVVVLAQASMARVLKALPESGTTILASPKLAVEHARQILFKT